MIDHRALAVDGVGYPPFILAVMGAFGYKIEVEVEPYYGGGSGIGYEEQLHHFKREKYKVKFIITTKNGKKFEKEYTYTEKQLRRLENVIAKFKVGYSVIEKMSIVASTIKQYVKDVVVKVRRK